MTNSEIISTQSMLIGFPYNGSNLKTYQEWKKLGYQVQRGEKATLQTKLWKVTQKKNDKGEKEKRMYMVNASLFSDKQVKRIEVKTN